MNVYSKMDGCHLCNSMAIKLLLCVFSYIKVLMGKRSWQIMVCIETNDVLYYNTSIKSVLSVIQFPSMQNLFMRYACLFSYSDCFPIEFNRHMTGTIMKPRVVIVVMLLQLLIW